MTFRVSLRTMEIGVRRVLGATGADILKLIMAQAGWLTLAGRTGAVRTPGAAWGVPQGAIRRSVLPDRSESDVPEFLIQSREVLRHHLLRSALQRGPLGGQYLEPIER